MDTRDIRKKYERILNNRKSLKIGKLKSSILIMSNYEIMWQPLLPLIQKKPIIFKAHIDWLCTHYGNSQKTQGFDPVDSQLYDLLISHPESSTLTNSYPFDNIQYYRVQKKDEHCLLMIYYVHRYRYLLASFLIMASPWRNQDCKPLVNIVINTGVLIKFVFSSYPVDIAYSVKMANILFFGSRNKSRECEELDDDSKEHSENLGFLKNCKIGFNCQDKLLLIYIYMPLIEDEVLMDQIKSNYKNGTFFQSILNKLTYLGDK